MKLCQVNRQHINTLLSTLFILTSGNLVWSETQSLPSDFLMAQKNIVVIG